MNSSISKDERMFCRFYRLRRNHREAAALSGYRDPEHAGLKLLFSKRLKRELENSGGSSVSLTEVADGLRRIAFGGVADAVRLLYSDELPVDIDGMDLFCVAELKRPKGGGMEIKFFDRIKALEQLKDISRGISDGSVEPFYRALELSAKGLFENGGGEDSGI